MFPEEEGSAIAETGEAAVLVTGVGLSEGLGTVRQGVACEERGVFFLIQGVRVQAEGQGEGAIEKDEGWGGDGRELPALMQQGGESSVGVVEVPAVVAWRGGGGCRIQ